MEFRKTEIGAVTNKAFLNIILLLLFSGYDAPASLLFPDRVLKKTLFAGCSKMARCKAPEVLRGEAYI
jgi:hypothetical protein